MGFGFDDIVTETQVVPVLAPFGLAALVLTLGGSAALLVRSARHRRP